MKISVSRWAKGARIIDQINAAIKAGEDFPRELWFSVKDWVRLCGELHYPSANSSDYIRTDDGTFIVIRRVRAGRRG